MLEGGWEDWCDKSGEAKVPRKRKKKSQARLHMLVLQAAQ